MLRFATLCLVTVALCAGQTATAAQPSIKIMTYNVNFGLSGDRMTLAAIGKGNADVIFLQETTPGWERVIRRRFRKKYKRIEFRHYRHAGGLAILSKLPFEDGGLLQAPDTWFPAWRVVLKTAMGPVQALNVHLRPPHDGGWVKGYFTTGPIREREMRYYMERLDPSLPTMVIGDFNENHGKALDMLENMGWRNALMDHDPTATTWRWPTSFLELRQTLDHVFHSPTLVSRSAKVINAGRSDHLPLLVTLHPAEPGQAALQTFTPSATTFGSLRPSL